MDPHLGHAAARIGLITLLSAGLHGETAYYTEEGLGAAVGVGKRQTAEAFRQLVRAGWVRIRRVQHGPSRKLFPWNKTQSWIRSDVRNLAHRVGTLKVQDSASPDMRKSAHRIKEIKKARKNKLAGAPKTGAPLLAADGVLGMEVGETAQQSLESGMERTNTPCAVETSYRTVTPQKIRTAKTKPTHSQTDVARTETETAIASTNDDRSDEHMLSRPDYLVPISRLITRTTAEKSPNIATLERIFKFAQKFVSDALPEEVESFGSQHWIRHGRPTWNGAGIFLGDRGLLAQDGFADYVQRLRAGRVKAPISRGGIPASPAVQQSNQGPAAAEQVAFVMESGLAFGNTGPDHEAIEAELAKQAHRDRELIQHPERCERCGGSGVIPTGPTRSDPYRTHCWCGCPRSEALQPHYPNPTAYAATLGTGPSQPKHASAIDAPPRNLDTEFERQIRLILNPESCEACGGRGTQLIGREQAKSPCHCYRGRGFLNPDVSVTIGIKPAQALGHAAA